MTSTISWRKWVQQGFRRSGVGTELGRTRLVVGNHDGRRATCLYIDVSHFPRSVAVSDSHAIPVFFSGSYCLNDLHSYEKSIRYLLKEGVARG